MTYILIIMAVTTGITTAEFNNKLACIRAADWAMDKNSFTTAQCFKKGLSMGERLNDRM